MIDLSTKDGTADYCLSVPCSEVPLYLHLISSICIPLIKHDAFMRLNII